MKLASLFTAMMLAQVGSVAPSHVVTITNGSITLTPIANLPPGPVGPMGPQGLPALQVFTPQPCAIAPGQPAKLAIRSDSKALCLFIEVVTAPGEIAQIIVPKTILCSEPISTVDCIDKGKRVLAPVIVTQKR